MFSRYRPVLISILAGVLATIGASAQTLRVRTPNGAEHLAPGDTVSIDWDGYSEGVRLHYSTDGGVSWRYIADRLTGNRYSWIVPVTPSGRCILRAIHTVVDSTITPADSPSGWLSNAVHNHDGTLAFTWSNYVLSVWDAVNVRLLWSRGGVASAQFSPDGLRVLARISEDQSYILDATTGAGITTLRGAFPVGFSDGGAFIYHFDGTTDYDNLIVRDAVTYAVRWKLPFRQTRTNVATDPGDRFIAITRNGSSSLVWNLRTGAGPVTLPYNGIGLCFKPDGSQFCLGVGYGSVMIFDTLTWKPVLTIPPAGSIIWAARYSSDGSKILALYDETYDGKFMARLWDAGSGELLGTFPNVKSVRFSPDEHAVVAVDIYDKLMRYGIDRTTDSDESDAVFTIDQPRMALRGSMYGQIGAPAVFRSRGSFAIRNDSRVPVTIRRILLSGSDLSAFTMAPPAGLQKLLPGDSLVVKTTFLPDRKGDFQARVLAVTETDTLAVPLTGTGVFLALRPYVDTVRFRPIKHFASFDSAIAVLHNVDTNPWTVTLSLAPGADTVGFVLANDGMPQTVQPGEDLIAHVRFTPIHENGVIYSRLSATYNGIGSEVRVALFGPGWLKYLSAPEEVGSSSGGPELTMYPNPARSSVRVDYAPNIPADSRLLVFDAMGRAVSGIPESVIEPGSSSTTIDLSGCPAGLYFVRILVNGDAITRPFIVAR
ncbi:MAG: yiaD [Chlorobi bacterium]|nr:yiaD [Chlorobiota bacterium]